MGKKFSRNQFIAIAIFSLAALFTVYEASSRVTKSVSPEFGELPDLLSEWKKTEKIGFEDRVMEILGTENVTGGVYENSSGSKISITIVHAVNNRSAFHPPEYCLTGSGSEIIEKGTNRVELLSGAKEGFKVNEMILTGKRKNKFLVWNWYGYGKTMTNSFYKQQLKLLADQLRSGRGEGVAITIYAGFENNDIMLARRNAADFSKALLPFLMSSLK